MSSHSLNSPSSFARRIACPGSANAERGIEDETSIYAAEGTAAHELGEACLLRGFTPDSYMGETFNETFVVDQDMIDAVKVYVDYCNDLKEDADVFGIEEKLPLPFIGEGEKGTADFVAIKKKKLHVVDYKHGQGVPVEAVENVQGLCYGLGAARRFDNYDWDELIITIVQPRAPHTSGPIRTWTVSRDDANDYALEFAVAAEATEDPNAPRLPGEHCRFCKAKPCPAQQEFSAEAAGIDFGDTTVEPKEVEGIEPTELSELILKKIPVIESWCKSVKEYAQHQAEQGKAPPGTKLVATRATRKWTDNGEAIKVLTDDYKLKHDQIYKSDFKSVAQIEKVVGKKNMADLLDLIESKSTGVTLVAESDPRKPARVSGTDDFGAV